MSTDPLANRPPEEQRRAIIGVWSVLATLAALLVGAFFWAANHNFKQDLFH